MPLIKIDLYPGRTADKKSDVARAITRVFEEHLGSDPRDVTIVFNDQPAENWFTAGEHPPARRS